MSSTFVKGTSGKMDAEKIERPTKKIPYGNGKIYFSRRAERKFYFILTVLMLLLGLLAKIGWV
jgi:hypothetical protein